MSWNLSIRDHAELQAAVLRATVAGGAYGLVQWHWPGPGAQAIGALAVGLAAVPPRSWVSAAVAAGVAALAGAASSLGGLAGALGFAALGGLTFARGASGGTRKIVAAAFGALGLATAGFVATTIGASGALWAIPPGLAALCLGGAAGFIASLGVTGRELSWAEEAPALEPAAPVEKPSTESPVPRTELGLLLDRAQTAFRDARAALGDGAPEAQTAAGDLLGRIERFGKHWSELDAEAARTDRVALAKRLEDVAAREEAAKDEVVRGEYARARAALRAQLDYLDGIERGHDRAVARLHHHIAVMERLRLAALHHRSADAARVGEELAPLVEDLTAAGRELDTAAEVLAELPALPALAN
jgi:hypothetical protein